MIFFKMVFHMDKFKFVIKLLIKYVLPVIAAWLEGDTHTLQTLIGF